VSSVVNGTDDRIELAVRLECELMSVPAVGGYDVGAAAIRVLARALKATEWDAFAPRSDAGFSSWLARPKPAHVEKLGNHVVNVLSHRCTELRTQRLAELKQQDALRDPVDQLRKGSVAAASALLDRSAAKVREILSDARPRILLTEDRPEDRLRAIDHELANFVGFNNLGVPELGSPETQNHIRNGRYEKLPRAANTIVLLLRERLKASLTTRGTKPIAIDVDSLSGVEFEAFIAERLRSAGATEVRGTPASGDQGADLLFRLGRLHIVAQTKRYSSPVGNAAVQEAYAAAAFYNCDQAWVVTNSVFTQSAVTLAAKIAVVLIDGAALPTIARRVREYSTRFP
jgi:HJR/Mrr/RecB family endonuclease